MNNNFLIKLTFTVFFILVFSSCSYLTPQSSNEYTVTKKSPLIMPPDMNMTPPESKNKKNQNKLEKLSNRDDKISIEDILTGDASIKDTKNQNFKKKSYSRKKLVNKILRTKASKVLE